MTFNELQKRRLRRRQAILLGAILQWSHCSAGSWFHTTTPLALKKVPRSAAILHDMRGGQTETPEVLVEDEEEEAVEEESLDQKVFAAMRKLGLKPPIDEESQDDQDVVCKDGVCELPTEQQPQAEQSAEVEAMAGVEAVAEDDATSSPGERNEDPKEMAERIAEKMGVDVSLAMAALGATASTDQENAKSFDEDAAVDLIQQELDRIQEISEDNPDVQQLMAEGFDTFLSRRALAFAEGNMEDARAILLADKMDEEEEERERLAQERVYHEKEYDASKPTTQQSFKTVSVDSNFDPSKIGAEDAAKNMPLPKATTGSPKPALKSDVVFEATGADVQRLVLESPVPVLLDVYADWCGPCKVLGPILEEMAVKSGGAFRLVKINTDNERAVSSTLQVTALPTVFGLRDGKILNMFQGMPRSEDAMKNFMMGLLIPGQEANFNPPLSAQQKQTFEELSNKLTKMAGAAAFPFSAREKLQDRVAALLDSLLEQTGNVLDTEESAQVLRSLLSNVIRSPYESKFRSVNLTNKVIAAKVAKYPAAVGLLKSVGFASQEGKSTLKLGKGKKVVNVAPLTIARDSIDKWIDKSRYEVAVAARKRKDEEDRKKLQAELEAKAAEDESKVDEKEENVKDVDPDACTLKLRMDGKKKVHVIEMHADDPLEAVLSKLPKRKVGADEEVKITCAAKRLIIRSPEDADLMKKSFRELGLAPSAAIVVSVGNREAIAEDAKTKLAERAASKKKLKKGSHTMQSIGIYAKDDNAKAELIDGGGGVWYEHDVSDDEESQKQDEDPGEETKEEQSNSETPRADKDQDASDDDSNS